MPLATDNAGRIRQALQLMHSARLPLFALATHHQHPERYSVERVREAGPAAQSAGDDLRKAIRLLAPLAEGAPPAAPRPEELDLADLHTLEALRPEYAELRNLLGQALSVAERIDATRGRCYEEMVGGSCGWDLAEEVNQLLARVENAAGGSKGKGLE